MPPDSTTAMRALIARIRHELPLDDPAARVCHGACAGGCAPKLLAFIEQQLDDWEWRLSAGARPGFAELSALARSARRVHAVLVRDGLLSAPTEPLHD
ncbi:hypothetical protein MARPU_09420 [Marichromatium purpuratum 984]|uniref:Uncharacterized protein n=1 Tax=Marichromatium purpuratum 984 TaxID=765910 RepID=W0E4R0_MARPU|nr:hypothetical protein [Marichromatium purpuratum]AHF04066.1 hypothetical protein MARPU_09420 [Marichromatium purpuratum 984]